MKADLRLEQMIEEREACRADPAYFLHHYGWLKDDKDWLPFRLWDFQVELIDLAVDASDLQLVLLKARQLGCTWVFLGLVLWGALFEPGSLALLFSYKLPEAKKLLKKLKGMYERLPAWLRADRVVTNNEQLWELSNGSTVEAYPASGGDSNNARRVLIDEADIIPNLGDLLDSVLPTIQDGGDCQLWMISRSKKDVPNSEFKRIYREARGGQSSWRHAFYPYNARPDRDEAFYARQVATSLAKDGTLDYVHGNYPRTDAEALAPQQGDKRLPATHLLPVYAPSEPLPDHALPRGAPAIPELRIYRLPVPGRTYVLGADPAEGLPGAGHDDSALVVLDKATGEEVAAAHGRWEPTAVFPEVIHKAATFFNRAEVLYERNNHGHSLRRPLGATGLTILYGSDGRPGWASSPASKVQRWADAWGEIVERAREVLAAQAEGTDPPPPLVRDFVTYSQLASLEASSCKAPQGEHDDLADAWGLAQQARQMEGPAVNFY